MSPKREFLRVLGGVIAVWAAATASCGGAEVSSATVEPSAGGVPESPSVFLPQVISSGSVSFDPPDLGRRVRLLDPISTRSPGYCRLQLELPIQNVSDRVVRLSVQLEFLDADRVAYGDRTAQRVLALSPGETRSVHATSAKARATTFAAHVRLD